MIIHLHIKTGEVDGGSGSFLGGGRNGGGGERHHLNVNILAEESSRPPASSELVGLELAGPEPGVETGRLSDPETAVVSEIVSGKLHPLLQPQAVVPSHIPGLSDPLKVTRQTFR